MTPRSFFIATISAVFLGVFLITGLCAWPVSAVLAQQTTAERQAQLQAELDRVMAEIDAQKKILSEEQKKGVSLERDVAILNAQISQAKLKIQAHDIAIQTLGKNIGQKTDRINLLGDKAEQGKSSLGQLLRKTAQIDDYSLTEIMLSNVKLSDFLQDLDSYFFVKQALNESLEVVKQARAETEVEKNSLDKQRNQEMDERISVEAEKRTIEKAEAEKKRLLNLSKTEQKNYQSQISVKEQRAAQIRSALFALRDSSAIPFGTALEYANAASAKTGVRAAFILGILTQESDLGKNIGTCNRPGDPPEKSWKEIMPGPADKAAGLSSRDDQSIFLEITASLGLDPNVTPLSCPIGKGWGGAMGPSQFIPTTWKGYASRIENVTGRGTANPWDPRDAITATAIYLADLGAGAGGYTAERTAALKYYAGGNWNKPANAFYGNQVMQKTTNIQENMIDLLN